MNSSIQIIQIEAQLISRLWHHISAKRRRQFGIIILLMILASFAEMLSIGTVLPFLGVLTNPSNVFLNPLANPFIHLLGLTSAEQLLLPITIFFIIAVLLAGSMRLLLFWVSTRLTFATGADLSNDIYRRTLYQSYANHVSRNSSEVISGISAKSNSVIYNIIFPALMLIASFVMLLSVLAALLYIDPFIALITFGGFGLIYIIIISYTRKRLLIDSHCMARESTNVVKSLQEGLGGIRDVLIDGTQATYCEIYRNADSQLRNAQGRSQFISSSPRYAMETLGMILIGVLAYILAKQPDGLTKAIPTLGVLAFGAQRLLPVLQQLYGAWSSFQIGRTSLQDVLELLDQPPPEFIHQNYIKPIPFKQYITLNKLSFRYSDKSQWVIQNLDLKIKKGSRIGLIGTTGSGKSTLIDIIMGLLHPSKGWLEVDGHRITSTNCRSWQAHIAHVPQAIFLADSSIEENIAFGVAQDRIDHARVKQAAIQAQIADTIESWPKQYQTFVGERGIRLSGGQRQRIGIARALYKQADVIIFDEATSALDNETEEAVMQAIENLSNDLTILIIAHRVTTLKNCTQILELCDGIIKRTGTYKEIVSKSFSIKKKKRN